ncbi:MAG: hypothetical protein AAFR58_03870, partial [Cyanobacteria bacterium J06627_28]
LYSRLGIWSIRTGALTTAAFGMERNEPIRQQGKTVSALPSLMLIQKAIPKEEDLLYQKKLNLRLCVCFFGPTLTQKDDAKQFRLIP